MVGRLRFTRRKAEEKKNPNSLRQLFLEIRTLYAEKTQKEFAAELDLVGRTYGGVRITERPIQKIENDFEYIRYLHIEKYAEYIGIPSGALLLFSRMKANSVNKSESNLDVARHMIAILRKVDDQTVFDVDELRRWKAEFPKSLLSVEKE